MRTLVVGGGIVGLTIVRELKRAGVKDIVLFEKGTLGKEASFAAAGMLAPQAETDKDDAFFRLCCAARDFYPQFAREILEESGVDIELDREGTLYAAFGEKDESEILKRFEWQSAAGLRVERLTAEETLKLEPLLSPDAIGSLYFPKDWQVENRSLLKGLTTAVNSDGIKIRLNTNIKSLALEPCPAVSTISGETIQGDVIIIATGAWTSLIETGLAAVRLPKITPVRGQMISYRTAKRAISKVIYSPRGYVVPRKNGKILAGATMEQAGFDCRVSEEGIRELSAVAEEIVPSVAELDIDDSWAGLRPRAADGLPLIGKVEGAENVYISTGHFRNGILLAPLTAKLLADSILSRGESEYMRPFGPARSLAASV